VPLRSSIPFTEDLSSRVQGFSCGDNPWEIEVAQWIQLPRGSGGALDAMEDQSTEVWLYETEAGELVGYTSLGSTEWAYPNPRKGARISLQIIPCLGIRKEFQGKPPSPTPREERYAWRIFEDLLDKAISRKRDRRWLGLLVHQQNEKAIAFYRHFGFADYGARKDYKSMLLDLGE
jgi:GNAT superfamily N-acetyltransferase